MLFQRTIEMLGEGGKYPADTRNLLDSFMTGYEVIKQFQETEL
jgi:hypothetical protein